MVYYNMQGSEITAEEFSTLMKSPEARVVEQVMLPNGLFVSTVLAGVNMRMGSELDPLIFETMVFAQHTALDEGTKRYCTLAQAKAGHAESVVEWADRWTVDGDK